MARALTKRQRVGVVLLVPLVLTEAWALARLASWKPATVVDVPVTQTLRAGDYLFALPPQIEGLALDVVAGEERLTTIALTPYVGTERARATLFSSRVDEDGVVHAAVRVQGPRRTLEGTLLVGVKKDPPTLSLRWEDAPDVAFEARLRGPFAALVSSGHEPIVEGSAEGKDLVLLTRGHAIAVHSGAAALRSGEAVLPTKSAFELVFGSAVDVTARALEASGFPVTRYAGTVTPSGAASLVLALGEGGAVVGATTADAAGDFVLAAATGEPRLFAAVDGTRTSPVVRASEGETTKLTSVPLGSLRVSVRDIDSGKTLPSRIVVHGIDGTREPNFGPHFRATGAGPMLDTSDGTIQTPLPAGRYRVSALRGIEYTVDARVITVGAGERAVVDLSLRHVVKTPGLAGCDFHVHSCAGFDSDVNLEDRVRSLVAVGVDFAVPSEHNEIGSYAVAADIGLDGWLGWVKGVEVTTADPLRGHFNVFPYEYPKPPPYLHSSLERIIKFTRNKSPESIVQVNHPRLEHGIGYFNVVAFDSDTMKASKPIPESFDTLEVYNGFDIAKRERTERNITEWIKLFEAGRAHWATGDSDSHTVQYGWAGFPRTYVAVAADHDGGEGAPLDVPSLIDSVKQGRAFVTSGPIVELTQDGRGPGGTLHVVNGTAKVHLRVRAAPWVDVSDVEVLVGGKRTYYRELPSQPPRIGTLPSKEDDERAANRFDEDVEVLVPAGAHTLVAVARARKVPDEAMPFMGFLPIGFTNPLVLR